MPTPRLLICAPVPLKSCVNQSLRPGLFQARSPYRAKYELGAPVVATPNRRDPPTPTIASWVGSTMSDKGQKRTFHPTGSMSAMRRISAVHRFGLERQRIANKRNCRVSKLCDCLSQTRRGHRLLSDGRTQASPPANNRRAPSPRHKACARRGNDDLTRAAALPACNGLWLWGVVGTAE